MNDSYNDNRDNSYKDPFAFNNDTHSSIGSDLIRDIKKGTATDHQSPYKNRNSNLNSHEKERRGTTSNRYSGFIVPTKNKMLE